MPSNIFFTITILQIEVSNRFYNFTVLRYISYFDNEDICKQNPYIDNLTYVTNILIVTFAKIVRKQVRSALQSAFSIQLYNIYIYNIVTVLYNYQIQAKYTSFRKYFDSYSH